jgi:hypothetical protein
MSVRSSYFGVTKLTKADSDKFRKQVTYGRPSAEAATAFERGKELLKAFETKGYAKVKLAKAE